MAAGLSISEGSWIRLPLSRTHSGKAAPVLSA